MPTRHLNPFPILARLALPLLQNPVIKINDCRKSLNTDLSMVRNNGNSKLSVHTFQLTIVLVNMADLVVDSIGEEFLTKIKCL